MDWGVFPIKGAHWSRSSRLENPRGNRRNTNSALNSARTNGSANRSALARCPATSVGSLIWRNASSPIEQSWLRRWTSRRRRLAWKPIFRKAGRLFSPLLMAKSRVLLTVVSVRRPRPSLVVLLDLAALVIHVQRWNDSVGQDARAKTARRPLGHATLEDQLHLIWLAQIQVLADGILEEDSARLRTVQYLRERELGLQNRHVVKITSLAIRWRVGMRQLGQPLPRRSKQSQSQADA